ncbi:ABC transporter permease [Corynebacterium coyleae]|uniref:ABC transporter permease n=1 Tax=Corynebacterium coyleae TaxID=53374 RepID=UPI002550B71D|nr:ABC transporter permease [Corynebacterium coyleae]MDK8664494.1 ABC transporter permease [Corynebacterium coyleae]MDK8707519.1 ABC transporter permease [Corynebacterium coyleae]MDK8734397.1 ABC transporter permease [Corynebacterium coyleae]MDK8893614.1 ABC transporter permease [Corynebacterium coyleae]
MSTVQQNLIEVNDTYLRRLSARPGLGRYLAQLWQRRHFIWAEARSKAFSRGRDMYLGRAWIVLQPILDTAVYILVFGVVLNLSKNIDYFIGYLVIGVIFFNFITRGLNSGAGLIQNSKGMISSFSFPKAALPLSLTVKQLLDNVAPAIVGLLIAFLYHGLTPSLAILTVPVFFLMIHLFSLGAMLIVARITAFVPDLKALVSTFTRGLFFVSGVFFDIHRFDSNETIQSIMLANPAYQFLTAVREATIYQTVPPLGRWLYLAAWTLGLLIIGLIFFWEAEERYARVR